MVARSCGQGTRVLLVGDAKYVHMRRWVKGLADGGVETYLLSPTSYTQSGVVWIKDEDPPFRPWWPMRWETRRKKFLNGIFARVRPDVIHGHQVGAYTLFPESLPSVPLFVSTWGKDIIPDSPEPEDVRGRKVKILQACDRVFALSDMLNRATRGYAGLDEKKVVTCYWGVDLDQFEYRSAPVRRPVIGFFKHLLPKYGPDVLVKALPAVVQAIPDARLLMIGSGSMEGELKTLAADLRVQDHIEWFGAVAYERIVDLYRRCAITVMPSTEESETLGVAALESQALGIPVVASRIGGIPESVADGRTGILVEPRSSSELSAAIIRLLADQELRTQFGQAGRQRVVEQFDWKQSVARTCAVYREAIEQRISSKAC